MENKSEKEYWAEFYNAALKPLLKSACSTLAADRTAEMKKATEIAAKTADAALEELKRRYPSNIGPSHPARS